MGKSNKLFKALVIGVKAFKSPSKDRAEKIKSASEGDKDQVKKASKDKCLWSLGKSSSRERNSVAAAAAYLDGPTSSFSQPEIEHVKDAPSSHSFTSTPAYSPRSLVKAEAASFSGCEHVELVEREELAAIKIQAVYRGHLASQQVFRALRAVVRLQALARGQMVRKQASATLRCMQAIVRLQALARGRRLRSSELGQLVQKHLQQTSQQRKKLVERWVSSISTLQQSQVKLQSEQDAVIKQQCALVYTFSDQLSRYKPTQHSPLANDFQPDKHHWGWVWLERWMAVRPWENPSGVVKEHNEEGMVNVKADIQVSEERKCISPLKDSVGNANIESTSSIDFESDRFSNSQLAMQKESMFSGEKMKEDHVPIPSYVEEVKRGEKLATEISSTINDSEIKKAASLSVSAPPPPPPPPPPLYAKRASPVAHVTTSPKGQQAAILANRRYEMPVAFTSAARAAELPAETCPNTLATQLNSPCDSEPASPELPSSPVKNLIPFTSANMPSEAFAAQTTLQSYPESTLPQNQSSRTTSSLTQEVDEVLPEFDMANVSVPVPVPSASDFVPISPAQTTSSPTVFPEELVLPLQKHAPASSPSCVSDVTHTYGMSHQGYISEGNGGVTEGERTTLAVPPIFGLDKGNVTTNPAESGSMDLENDPVDMDTEVPESIDCKMEVIHGGSLSEANGGCDASGTSGGEKITDVSSSKHASPVSKQGQHAEAGSPSVPNYMTKTKCSQAKIRALASPVQRLDSTKQKGDSPKPRFDSSSKQKGNSPKLKPDSPKQKFDSPMQKAADSTIKRRHSLSATEGKSSPGALKSSPYVRASSKAQVASLKDTCAENLPFSNGGSRKHGKLVAV